MRIMILMIMCVVMVMNIYMLQLSVNNLQLNNELAQNASERSRNATTQRLDLLDRQSEDEHAARTDYAWHFNQGHKLDILIDDINDIKNELGLVQNVTPAGPNRTL